MSDNPDKAKKKRRLRNAGETVRERVQRSTDQPNSRGFAAWKQIKQTFGFVGVGASYVTKPIQFIGHYIIPPYFRNSWRELRLVTWPSRKQTRQLTLAVIMFSVVIGSFVALLDLGFGKLFKQVIIK